MVYIVSVDYKEFKFDESITAIGFAEMAKNKAVGSVRVGIEVRTDEEEKECGEDA